MRTGLCSSCTCLWAVVLVTIVIGSPLPGHAQNDVYQLSFFANANSLIADQTVSIVNPGVQGTPLTGATLCADIYVFDASQHPLTCCACHVNANGILRLSLRSDLLPAAALPARRPDSGVIKIVSDDAPKGCNAAKPHPVPNLRTSMTHLELAPLLNIFRLVNSQSDLAFADSLLSQQELVSLAEACQKLTRSERVCVCPPGS